MTGLFLFWGGCREQDRSYEVGKQARLFKRGGKA